MIYDGRMMFIEIRQLVFIGFFVNGLVKSLLHPYIFFVNLTSAFCSSLCAASMYRHPSASEGT